MNKAVFLDKDGTLIRNIAYSADPKKVTLMPFVGEGLRLLRAYGYKLIIISNQSGVARGYFKEKELEKIYEKLQELVKPYHISFDGFYYCPHHPEAEIAEYKKNCTCRKPSPGLFYQARKVHHVDLAKSWMMGDILDDCEAGKRAGCRTIFLDADNETEWKLTKKRIPDAIASNFLEGAKIILNRSLADETLYKNKEAIYYE